MAGDKTQERFEAWAEAGSYDLVKDDSGSYISVPTVFAWMGYKTASAERDAEVDAWKVEAEESRNRVKIERDDHRDYCERLIRSGELVAKTKDRQINNLAAEIERLRDALTSLETAVEQDMLDDRSNADLYHPSIFKAMKQARAAKEHAWPAGCHDPNSCHTHNLCMYVNCRHYGADINPVITSAFVSTEKQ